MRCDRELLAYIEKQRRIVLMKLAVWNVCHDGAMPYEFDEQARQEAADHPGSEAEAARLRDQCVRKAAELGEDGVRGDTIGFSLAAWDEPPGLPGSIPKTGRISRGDVLDIGERVRAGTFPAADLFAASFVWGWGTTGFGPSRFRDIHAAAGDRLEPSLQRVLVEINKLAGSPDPIAGYAQPPGGQNSAAVDRVSAGAE
jgi:hypothetical protein